MLDLLDHMKTLIGNSLPQSASPHDISASENSSNLETGPSKEANQPQSSFHI